MSRNKNPEETVALILDVSLKLFLEKGYEKTSIQDIIDNLGGLSKGAIYHHFKSKEDILLAVIQCSQEGQCQGFLKIKDDKSMTGIEKLRQIFQLSFDSLDFEMLDKVTANVFQNPKFLAEQLQCIFTFTSPTFIQPIIEEGIKDGTIKTAYPKQLSEILILLTNIWLNPSLIQVPPDELLDKFFFFIELLKNMGLDVFTAETVIEVMSRFKSYLNTK